MRNNSLTLWSVGMVVCFLSGQATTASILAHTTTYNHVVLVLSALAAFTLGLSMINNWWR